MLEVYIHFHSPHSTVESRVWVALVEWFWLWASHKVTVSQPDCLRSSEESFTGAGGCTLQDGLFTAAGWLMLVSRCTRIPYCTDSYQGCLSNAWHGPGFPREKVAQENKEETAISFIIIRCSLFTMLQLFQVYSKVIHMHIYSFRFFSITKVYYKVFWMEFPHAISRTNLVVYLFYMGVCICSSQTLFLLPPHFPLW